MTGKLCHTATFVYTQNTQCPLRLACDLVSWLSANYLSSRPTCSVFALHSATDRITCNYRPLSLDTQTCQLMGESRPVCDWDVQRRDDIDEMSVYRQCHSQDSTHSLTHITSHSQDSTHSLTHITSHRCCRQAATSVATTMYMRPTSAVMLWRFLSKAHTWLKMCLNDTLLQARLIETVLTNWQCQLTKSQIPLCWLPHDIHDKPVTSPLICTGYKPPRRSAPWRLVCDVKAAAV